MKTIDMNCDVGEGVGNDEQLMPYLSSASIACGCHAGDEATMKQTVELCKKYRVSIGAHPSYPDRINFGRSDMRLPLDEVYGIVVKQIQLLDKIAKASGASLRHVKPHGALYNMAARDRHLALTVARAVFDTDRKLVLFGLSGSYSIAEGKIRGLKTASEVFADRAYNRDGSLIPRRIPGAMIENVDKAVAQALEMATEGTVTTVTGSKIPVVAETICIHGDGPHAAAIAKAVHAAFTKEGIEIKSG